MKIDYNKDTLSLIQELSIINPKIYIESNENYIEIKNKNQDNSALYIFKAPKNHFSFIGNDCSFYNYTEFYKLFVMLNQPDIHQFDTSSLELIQNNTELHFKLHDSEICESKFKGVDFSSPVVTVQMNYSFIKKISAIASQINANQIRVKAIKNKNCDKLELTLKSTISNNSCKETIDIKLNSDYGFEYTISTLIFKYIPKDKTYDVGFSSEGLIEFKMIDENIDLKLYTAELDD